MKTVMQLLKENARVSDFKINEHRRESYELFFVKGRLETVRCTDTCDREVTVYVDHDGFKGDARFFVYPSTTAEQLKELIGEAVEKALLINNPAFDLPGAEQGEFTVKSNFADYDPAELAAAIGKTVFAAGEVEHASLNAVEVFVNRHTKTVANSRGLHKSQLSYDAMVEAIPTYNGEKQSVELYEQYNFNVMDEAALRAEIAGKMAEVKARYEAVTPDFALSCPVVLDKTELAALFRTLANDLTYSAVYTHANLFKKGDALQKEPAGDRITMTMAGEAEGCMRSARFDADGLTLGSIRVVEDGCVVNYHGDNRFGQYLGETPSGSMPCVLVEGGSLTDEELEAEERLEVISMSGLQVDLNNDYIGGEIRLARYHRAGSVTPLTGISFAGSLAQVLGGIRLSGRTCARGGYSGPENARLDHVKIF